MLLSGTFYLCYWILYCLVFLSLQGIKVNPVKAKATYCSIGPLWDCGASLLAVAANKRPNLSSATP